MKYTKIQNAARVLIAGACLTAVSKSQAYEAWLRTGLVTNTMPDGQAVVFWAFAQDSANWAAPGPLTVPGPQLKVVAGDSLILHVTNTLPEPISIVVPGQYGFDVQAPAFFSSGPYAGRARSLNHEAGPTNGVATFTWKNVQSGTFLYHSGSHPSVQVQMGLYGALTVAAPGPQIYAGVPYNSEATLLMSEVDARLHAAVTGGTFGPGPQFFQTDFTNAAALVASLAASANPVAQWVTANISGAPDALASDLNSLLLLASIYSPSLFPDSILEPTTKALMLPYKKLNQDYPATGAPFMGDLMRMNRMLLYDGLTNAGIYIPPPSLMSSANRAMAQYFMMNGQPYTNGVPAIAAGAAGSTTLLRFLNAGMDLRTPTLNNGGDLLLVGEDGQQAPYSRPSAVVTLPALKTVDALWTPPASGSYAIYERHGGMVSGANLFGGSLTFLSAGAAGSAAAPTILVQPASQTVPEFSTATFGVVAGGAGLTYQWRSNGVAIAGATAPYYSMANVNRTNTGVLFTVVVSGTGGSPVTSAAASLTVTPAAPVIIAQPARTNVTLVSYPRYSAAAFSVAASGSAPMTYQWFQGPSAAGPFTAVANSATISGATSSNLVFSSTFPTNGGWYQVVVTGPVIASPGVFVAGAGVSVTSVPAELGVPPFIVTRPAPVTVPDMGSATFSVVATGTGLTYQWFRQGGGPQTFIAGATTTSYTLSPVHLTDNNAAFRVIVGGDAGLSVTSAPPARLTVTPISVGPFITSQPVSINTNAGAPEVSFTVVAYGDPAPTYQWQRFNGTAWASLVGVAGMGGASTPTLTVRPGPLDVTLTDAGSYRVVIRNSSGSVTSSVAALTVTQTFAGAPVTTIPLAGGSATPYPARTAVVPPLIGAEIRHVSVSMNFSSDEPYDVTAMLVSPGSAASARKAIFMSGLGPIPSEITFLPNPELGLFHQYSVTNCALTFDDSAPAPASTNYWLAPGTYQSSVNPLVLPIDPLPAPAPGYTYPQSYPLSLGAFNGLTAAAGRWNLYVNDLLPDFNPAGLDGTMSSWSLTLTAGPIGGPPPPPVAPSAPLEPTVISPGAAAPGSLINTFTPTFTWTTVAGATQYIIVLRTVATGQFTDSPWLPATQVAPGNAATATYTWPTALAPGTYVWWVVAGNAAGNSHFSGDLAFATPNAGAASLTQPISPNGPAGTTTPNYTFSLTPQAQQYQILVTSVATGISTSLGPFETVNLAGGTIPLTGTYSIPQPTPLAPGNYTWILQTELGGGWSWSNPMNFSVP